MARERQRTTGRIVLGTVLIVAGGLWTLIWAVVAVLAAGFGGDARGWVLVAAALGIGVYVFFLGVSFVRGVPSFGGILRFSAVGLVVAPNLVAAFVAAREESRASPVNLAVERQYMKRGKFASVSARCSHIEKNPDESESWVCDVQTERPYDLDTCNVDIRRPRAGKVTAKLTYCLNDDLGPG